jgi:hypothetical protein
VERVRLGLVDAASVFGLNHDAHRPAAVRSLCTDHQRLDRALVVFSNQSH